MNANMNENPQVSWSTDQSGTRGGGYRRIGTRGGRFMVAPARPGIGEQAVTDRLKEIGNVEILRTLAPRGEVCPPVAVVRMSHDAAAALCRTTGGNLVVEVDEPLRAAAALAAVSPVAYVHPGASAIGPGFATTIQVLTEGGQPVERAEVELVGEQWTAQGVTGQDGMVALTLYGELPERVRELIVKPRTGYWGLWLRQPELSVEAPNTVTVRPLADLSEAGWGAQAMQLDRLPTEYRGRGAKIALIDSGVATSHKQLGHIEHGFEVDGRTWSQDAVGHGTPCAGIIAAASNGVSGIRGYAPEAELHVCKLPLDAHCSDLAAALDYCIGAGIDVACIGFACERGSAIVEQRIAAAKHRGGMAVVAAAGNMSGSVQFPACSRHALAVGAIGQLGTFPEDSPQAAHAAQAIPAAGGLFVPAFSCRGLELDLCAPGVAVISCQSPEGYAVCDGTSLAAAHVAAVAGLVLAHHADFRREFANRDAGRVERLFQILKETAQPVGQPWQTGAGLPDAVRALGRPSQVRLAFAAFHVGLAEMRNAVRMAGLGDGREMIFAEPPRGPAAVTQLPLNPSPLTSTMELGGEAGMQTLKDAMQLAGLSAAG